MFFMVLWGGSQELSRVNKETNKCPLLRCCQAAVLRSWGERGDAFVCPGHVFLCSKRGIVQYIPFFFSSHFPAPACCPAEFARCERPGPPSSLPLPQSYVSLPANRLAFVVVRSCASEEPERVDEISARERVWEGGYPRIPGARQMIERERGSGELRGIPSASTFFFSLSLRSCLLLRPPTALLVRYRFAERCRFVVRVILAAVIRSPPVLTQRSRDEESPSRGSCSRDPRDRNRWVFNCSQLKTSRS